MNQYFNSEIRTFASAWKEICSAVTNYIGRIENYTNEVENSVLGPLGNVKQYMKGDKEELEEKFNQANKHFENCQQSAEKALRNIIRINEQNERPSSNIDIVDLLNKKQSLKTVSNIFAHCIFFFKPVICYQMLTKSSNFEEDYKRALIEQKHADEELARANIHRQMNISVTLETMESIEVSRSIDITNALRAYSKSEIRLSESHRKFCSGSNFILFYKLSFVV